MTNDLIQLIDSLMVNIPAGEVVLRDDRIKKEWLVQIQPFLLAKYAVTTELYDAITNSTLNNFVKNHKPVVNISWNDAITFCNVLSKKAGLKEYYSISDGGQIVRCKLDSNGYRLLSEAEWQYACKAGTTGYTYGKLHDIAWYNENSNGHIHDVGQKEPNAWGLYDMLGNVWEWCYDLYDEKVYGSYRIFRGGSWAEVARGCGATCRRRSHPTFHIEDLGFRLARSI
ncbi:formylglycine-generating enzyme family protein [Bacillus cereus]|uniref:formylglycine-generating enzyme family protein n=1 Tax=Bacillus cereus group TaxID=86661 RepID=UPI000BF7D0A6|nr:SUMF1/EgtB/PvdO family nonheme iron enzyme [Bacillus thuringiensis]MCU5129826.1 formylglycine-generating enzyme family protein [Bacillus cereus]KAB2369696.1 formylglycine-generating enzyme family protein [Bacillus thuringiensis]MCU5527882.1 formylglycine-generating enzyme family protein [Bacillus cereus]MCU5541002.1 formylglycine-generating enzyme family protein [Bacillus cereus]MED3358498.1 SUMF1/EgtB/PvdO family nonheme iron enzyme [Bacillus thuringiensis]